MSKLVTKITLGTYKLFGSVVYPFMGPFLQFRARKGKEERRRRYERYGYSSHERPKGPLVWFHAASVGEAMAVLALIERVDALGLNTILTTGTVTSAEVVEGRLPASAFHQYVPLDLKPAIDRFLEHWKPDLAIFTESEIWPTTIQRLKANNIRQVLVNARMSDRSFKRWSQAPKLAEELFHSFDHVAAQSENDADRFRSLGARPVSCTGNLKVDIESLPVVEEQLNALKEQAKDRVVWIAASTHKGEEEIIARTHLRLMQDFPNLLTVLVPRHPERRDAIVEIIKKTGLSCIQRSTGQSIDKNCHIYLGDTIGEMGLYLRMGSVVFMGRSLAHKGGQNALEPAAIGAAIISGKNVTNFRDVYKNLLQNNGVRLVQDEDMLLSNLAYLFNNENERQKMIEGAQLTVEQMSGALENTIEVLDSYLFPLTVKYKLEGINNGS
ncbi:MAG: 3-deoxy-D-manno-octulosonic acid transferase [Nitratireductor sp.]